MHTLTERRKCALAITKARKDELVEQYVGLLENSQGLVITEYRGLTVSQFDNVRKKMRDIGSKYVVTKNTLFKIALEKVGMPVPEDLLNGPVAVGFALENFPGTVKAILDSRKDIELLLSKGAVTPKSIYQADSLKDLSELPSLDESRAMLAAMVVQPASQLLSLLVAPQRDLVNVLAAYVDKNGEGDDADAA
jgi:large subunit ribosomal protein L10